MPTECILNRLVLFGFERRSFSAMSFITPHCTGHHWKHTLNSTIRRTLTRFFSRQTIVHICQARERFETNGSQPCVACRSQTWEIFRYSCEKCDANGCAKKIRNTRLDEQGQSRKKKHWSNHAINMRNIHVVVMLIGAALVKFELKTRRMSSDWKDFWQTSEFGHGSNLARFHPG